ncbi:MAG TPA: DUF5666 domain-containing protein [Vicinamibacterales bacterium]|nr:DUF5666 domain-containing protein [Vicinamibacterales bacterium]
MRAVSAIVFPAVIASAVSARAATISIPSGGDLQQAINAAQPGDTIALTPGAVYSGSFTLTVKSGDAPITIRTAGDAGLPGDGARISPAHAPALAVVRQASGLPAIQTAAGAHHWRLMLLEIQGNGTSDIVTLGDGSSDQRTSAQLAHDLQVDRVYLHGDGSRGQKRGIALNSASTTITGSYIADIKSTEQDSQAIGGWNGPGPYGITNNHLEASGENVMFGGTDPSIAGLVPSDITIADNQFFKPPSWRAENWVVKNLFELKNARRVSVLRNTFDYNWEGGQSGYAILFTVRNQDGNCPWCQVDHVTFEQNIVRHASAGVEILGYDDIHPSQQTQAIVIRNNLFADIDSQNWGGNGYFLAVLGGPRDITVDHNTIISDHGSGIVDLDGPPVLRFTFTNNLARHNLYGFIGTDHGIGADSISTFLPGSVITRNVIAGGSAAAYPAGNSFPSPEQFASQFDGYGSGNYRLIASSPWRGAATDGGDLGAVLNGDSSPGSGQQAIDGEGVITAAVPSTACPALQFIVGTYRVAVNGSTQFSGGTCASLTVGTTIHGRGLLGPDGTVTLSQVEILSGGGASRAAEGRGVVTAILPGSTCSAGGVTIGVYTVTIDGATQFTSGSCNDVNVGVTLDVAGYFTADTVIRATQIGVVR